MFTARRIAIVATLGLATVTVIALVIAMELNRSSSVLANTQNTLADTQASLADQSAANEDLTAQNRTLETEKGAVEEVNVNLEATLNDARNENRDLANRNTTLAGDLQQSTNQLKALEDDLGALEAKHTTLAADYGTLESEHETLKETAGTAQSLADRIDELNDDIDELNARIDELNDDIDELDAIREPLILGPNDAHIVGFACTGSMEPVITCLDEARWLDDFKPEDITVGSTISFDPDCWESIADGSSTAHRVLKIRIVNGVHQFWPKGDNNEEPDGCWVPETNVNGYIIAIYKNVRPERAPLRNAVNKAKADYIQARDEYRDYRERNGCHRSEGECLFDYGAPYQTALRLYNKAEDAHVTYLCWIDYAKEDRAYGSPIPKNMCQAK